jgi:hypothetical protein
MATNRFTSPNDALKFAQKQMEGVMGKVKGMQDKAFNELTPVKRKKITLQGQEVEIQLRKDNTILIKPKAGGS